MAGYNGRKVGLGNSSLAEDFNAIVDDNHKKLVEEWQVKSQTVMYLVIDNKVEGIVGVADKIKETSAKAVQMLQKMHINVLMFTGDNELTNRQTWA